MKNLKIKTVWSSPGGWMTVKSCGDFFFAERKGRDSVAFILYDSNRKNDQFGLIKEFKNPFNKFMITAYGGSLDKDKSLEEIVREEVKEESGYTVDLKHITLVDTCLVSTQMNQMCYLYLVDVTGLQQGHREPENEYEAAATPVWLTLEKVIKSNCWKAKDIVLLSKLKKLIK